MGLIALLQPLVALIATGAFLWLVVVAFRKSAGWGLGVLLLSPIAAIIFAIRHWDEAKKPFVVCAGGWLLSLVFLVYMFSAVGGFEMVEMVNRMQDGELDENTTRRFIESTIERMENSGSLSPEEQAELDELKQMLREMHSEEDAGSGGGQDSFAVAGFSQGESDAKAGPSSFDSAEQHFALSSILAGMDRSEITSNRSISFNQAPRYLGERVRVVRKDGLRHEAVLREANTGRLVLERYLRSGTFSFELRRGDVKSLEVLAR